jgi:hypothetical protein
LFVWFVWFVLFVLFVLFVFAFCLFKNVGYTIVIYMYNFFFENYKCVKLPVLVFGGGGGGSGEKLPSHK